MRASILTALLSLVAVVLCWAGALAYWRATNRMPSTSDLALGLLALPLGVLALVWLGRRLLAPKAAPLPAAAAASTEAAPPVPGASLALLAAALRTPHGGAPEELAEAIAAQRARGDLDPELLDDDGYPIMSARVADPVDAEQRAEIAEWLAQQGRIDANLLEEQWRALGMASAVALELAHQAAGHPHAVADADGVQPPMLQVLLALSGGWDEAQRGAAAAWIGHIVELAGWPGQRIAVAVHAQPAPTAAVSTWLTELTRQAAATPTLALLLACDSQIGEASVNQLAAHGRLFVSSRAQGLIPGEGAAGLLLGDATQAALLEMEPTLLHTVAAQRDNSADAAGKPDAALLRELATRACVQGALEPAALAMVLADADHRTSRIMEVMSLATATLPHLDAGLELQCSGAACGHAGAVPFVAALALAHHHAQERGAPVLCVSNDDPYHRSAVLVRPPVLPT